RRGDVSGSVTRIAAGAVALGTLLMLERPAPVVVLMVCQPMQGLLDGIFAVIRRSRRAAFVRFFLPQGAAHVQGKALAFAPAGAPHARQFVLVVTAGTTNFQLRGRFRQLGLDRTDQVGESRRVGQIG